MPGEIVWEDCSSWPAPKVVHHTFDIWLICIKQDIIFWDLAGQFG